MCYDQEKTQAPPREKDFYRRADRAIGIETNQAGCEAARPMSSEEILAKFFSYQPPTILTLPKYAAINQAAKNFAEVILQNCPPSADRSDAIRKIREARMTANASIALDGLSL